MIAQCCAEAEALDVAGHLAPPAMHRALGDRRDRLVGLNEGTKLLPKGSALGRLVGYLKSLAHELGQLGYERTLTIPTSVMLACYDGAGAFYKPHMDSMNSDPRRLTAIVYLVPPDWDARPEKDGGRLVWWLVDEESNSPRHVLPDGSREPVRQTTEPKAGRLVLFNARTVMHEVCRRLPPTAAAAARLSVRMPVWPACPPDRPEGDEQAPLPLARSLVLVCAASGR